MNFKLQVHMYLDSENYNMLHTLLVEANFVRDTKTISSF